MTKKQKVWLGCLVAVPVIIEILFQSTARLVKGVITLKNITFGHKYSLVLAQSEILFISAVFAFAFRKSFRHQWQNYLLIGFLLLWAVIAYLSYYDALNSSISVGGF